MSKNCYPGSKNRLPAAALALGVGAGALMLAGGCHGDKGGENKKPVCTMQGSWVTPEAYRDQVGSDFIGNVAKSLYVTEERIRSGGVGPANCDQRINTDSMRPANGGVKVEIGGLTCLAIAGQNPKAITNTQVVAVCPSTGQ